MSETHVSSGDPREAAGDWIGSLLEQGRSEYQAFEVLAELPETSAEALAIRRALCAMVDVLLVEELPEAEAFRASANRLIRQPLARAAGLFERWAACLAAVQPHRGRLAEVCAHFPEWVESVPPDFREESLLLMPHLLGAHGRAGLAWLPALAARAAAQPSAELRARLLDLARTYLAVVATEDGPRTLEACAALVATLPGDDLAAFCRACPAEAIFQDGEAADFLDQFVRIFHGLPEPVRTPFVRLMTELAAQSFSSAGYLAGRLPSRLDALPEAGRVPYLEYFRRLIMSAGIAANRFAFKVLPRRLAERPEDEIRRLVETVEAIGANYGRAAAIRFLESRD
jgi:hypothetical protein